MARILITNFHPGGGGHDSYIQALTQMPESSGHVVGVAAPIGSQIYQYLRDCGYPSLYPCDFPAKIQKELPDILKSTRQFRKIVSEFKPDIVHTNGAADLFIAVWSHPNSCPYRIVRTHHAIRNIPNDIYHRWLYSHRAIDNIYVCQSSFDLSTTKGLTPSNPIVIANGVDLERFHPIQKNTTIAHEYDINDQCFCFGSCESPRTP